MSAARRRALGGVVALASLSSTMARAAAAEVTPGRPLELVRGSPAGFSTAQGGDARRSFAARALPRAASAEVLWRQRVPSGVFANVLVDAVGSVFVAGDGSVYQLDARGQREFSARGAFGAAAAAALLVDGKRAVLTRDGQLLAWSAGGAVEIHVMLAPAARSAPQTLLPAPDGGVLASIGAWLFHVDAGGAVIRHTALDHDVVHSLLVEGRALLVDDRGDVFDWGPFAEPQRLASSGAKLAAVAGSADGALVAVTATGAVVQLGLGPSLLPVALAPSGFTAVLAVRGEGGIAALRRDGQVIRLDLRDRSLTSLGFSLSRAEDVTAWLVSDAAVAAIGTERPLSLRDTEAERELAEVRCRQPSSLASAGLERLVVACRDGSLWAIGPARSPSAASPGAPTDAGPAELRATPLPSHGTTD